MSPVRFSGARTPPVHWVLAGSQAALSGMPLVELNEARLADLESVAGIGPSLSARLLAERQRSAFLDWPDLVARVKGVGWHGALRLSRAGLRIMEQAHPEDRAAAPESGL